MFNKKFKKYICISVGIVGTSFVGLKALAKYKRQLYLSKFIERAESF